jgi:predicted TIM-barrel fold metal-dependent hydrolase
MIGDAIVVDAVVHPYNLAPTNQNPDAQPQLESVYAAHELATDPAQPQYRMSREEFFSDVSFATVASACFSEADVDFAFIHALPNLGFAREHVTAPRRAAAARDAHPNRFGLYATVDTPIAAAAIEELEWQVQELGVDGLKLYPAFFYEGHGAGWRLDGEDFAVPLLEAAHDLGIRNVAVHKALWLPPAPREAFRVDDVGGALRRFPDMNFFIVHAGMAFIDETIELLVEHPNMHATLESLFAYICVRPEHFAERLGRMIAACGSERLLYGSGANLSHPRPLLEAFADYELPAELLERHGWQQITEQDRRNILGLNALRVHGLDPEAVRQGVADDAFARARAEGPVEPWSVIRGAAQRIEA